MGRWRGINRKGQGLPIRQNQGSKAWAGKHSAAEPPDHCLQVGIYWHHTASLRCYEPQIGRGQRRHSSWCGWAFSKKRMEQRGSRASRTQSLATDLWWASHNSEPWFPSALPARVTVTCLTDLLWGPYQCVPETHKPGLRVSSRHKGLLLFFVYRPGIWDCCCRLPLWQGAILGTLPLSDLSLTWASSHMDN